MALLFMDGFDYGSLRRWEQNTGTLFYTNTRFGVGSCIGGGYNSYVKKATPPTAKVIVGFAYNPNSVPSGPEGFFTLYGDSATVSHLTLQLTVSGVLELRRGEWNGVLLGSSTISTVGWQFIEIAASINDTTGTATVRVNGVVLIDFVGDTRNAGSNTSVDGVRLRFTGNGPTYFDDFYLCDDTGTTNNTFLGDVRVQTLLPTGAGSSTQLTPTGGANYANVAENPDSTATYNTSSTVGDRDTYAMADVSASTGPIYGVQNSIVAWKSDAGTGSLKTALKSGASVYYDATQSLGSSPMAYLSPVRETNPATSTAWTVSDVNNAELGVEVA